MTEQEKLKLHGLIQQGDLQETIKILLSTKMKARRKDEILSISSRYERLKKQSRSGVIDFNDANKIENQIAVNLLELINQINEDTIVLSEHEKELVEVIIEGSLLEFTSEKRKILINTIAAILEIDKSLVKLKKVVSGSVKVLIEIPAKSAKQLIELSISESFNEDIFKLSKGEITIIQINLVQDKSQSALNTSETSKVIWKYVKTVAVIMAILGGTAEVLNFLNLFPFNNSHNLQLTVFVTDIKGNAVLENEGKLNIPLGNRSLNEVIGTNGRTNFPDITGDNKGDTIVIGLDAPGWEIVEGKNTFVFTGEPIRLKVKKDDTLGTIKGVVKSRDGQNFIEGALVQINTDTFAVTNKLGVFRIVLPEKMRIKSDLERYLLTVSKEGYETQNEYYSPLSSDAEFRLNKK